MEKESAHLNKFRNLFCSRLIIIEILALTSNIIQKKLSRTTLMSMQRYLMFLMIESTDLIVNFI